MIKNVKLDGVNYLFKEHLSYLARRVALTVWREEGFGETCYSCAGSAEDWKKIGEIADSAVEMIANKTPKRDVLDYVVKTMFPETDVPKLIDAINGGKLRHSGFEETMIVCSFNTTLPEYLDTYAALTAETSKGFTN